MEGGAEGGQQVVRVHDDVDEGIQEAEERAVTAGGEFNSEPDRHRHTTVMDDVKRRHVAILLPQHEENLKRKRQIRRNTLKL